MKVAIVGSREFPKLLAVDRYVRQLPEGSVVISGGARGVDSAAEFAATQMGLETVIIKPQWKRDGVYNPAAGFERNVDIIAAADRVVAFWDGMSKGTAHSITLAVKSLKPTLVVYPKGLERQVAAKLTQQFGVGLPYLDWTTSDVL